MHRGDRIDPENHPARVAAVGQDDTSYWVTFVCAKCGHRWRQHAPEPLPYHAGQRVVLEVHGRGSCQ